MRMEMKMEVGDGMIKTKHYLNNIIEMISKLSNVITITTTCI